MHRSSEIFSPFQPVETLGNNENLEFWLKKVKN